MPRNKLCRFNRKLDGEGGHGPWQTFEAHKLIGWLLHCRKSKARVGHGPGMARQLCMTHLQLPSRDLSNVHVPRCPRYRVDPSG